MRSSERVRRLFRTGEIARSIQRAHLEWMAQMLGVDEQCVARQYGVPPLPKTPESFVYLIGHSERPADGEPVKIGYTRNLPLRLETMQPGSVAPLLVVAVREGGRAEEREIHEQLFEYQIREDWFEMSDAVRDIFGSRGSRPRGLAPAGSSD